MKTPNTQNLVMRLSQLAATEPARDIPPKDAIGWLAKVHVDYVVELASSAYPLH